MSREQGEAGSGEEVGLCLPKSLAARIPGCKFAIDLLRTRLHEAN